MSQTKIDISNLADSVIAALSVPKITTIDYPGDDTAADPAGNQLITLVGSGFNTGAQVFIDGTAVGVVTVLSSTQLTFITPAKASGSYELRVVNTDGGLATSVNNIQYSGVPVWTTPSGSLANVYEGGSVTSTLSATSDTAVTYSVTSGTLPTGTSLTGNTISGTTGSVVGDTTYSFTIDAIDAELQNTSRNFSIGVLADVVTWNSPANNSTITANVNTAINQVLSASALSGSSITYSANSLPTGVSIVSGNITGTPTVVANSTSLLTATSTQSSKTATRTINFQIQSGLAPGQAEYTGAGTYTWVAPAGVTSVCVVCIGGGGGGIGHDPATTSTSNSGFGGGGGGLGWKNNIAVTPGQSYTVVVGAGGPGVVYANSNNGGNSYFINTSTVAGYGGSISGLTTGGGYVGDGGGNGGYGGGQPGNGNGGGGAGGYSGNGGNGDQNATGGGNGNGGGGGGGGACTPYSSTAQCNGGGGGGVGIFGQGTSGSGGTGNPSNSYGFGGNVGSPGGSASNGGNAFNGYGGFGGYYGAGGGGASIGAKTLLRGGDGRQGAVRIIWGSGRAFPSTNTQNM